MIFGNSESAAPRMGCGAPPLGAETKEQSDGLGYFLSARGASLRNLQLLLDSFRDLVCHSRVVFSRLVSSPIQQIGKLIDPILFEHI